MANIDTVPIEVLLLILEAKGESNFDGSSHPILHKGDLARLACVNRTLYHVLKPLIWREFSVKLGRSRREEEEIKRSGTIRKAEPIVQLYNSLVHNPANASLIQKASISWYAEPRHLEETIDVDCREDGQIRKKQITHHKLMHNLLRRLRWLKYLKVDRSVPSFQPTQYNWTLAVEEYHFLTSLSLSGFNMKSQDLCNIIANEKLRSLKLDVGIAEAKWSPSLDGLHSNVTHLNLSLEGWEDSLDRTSKSVIKDILLLSPGLIDLTLTVGARTLRGIDNISLILDELGQRCKIRFLNLRSQEGLGVGKVDLQTWNYLEALHTKAHCLFPTSATSHERMNLYSRLPSSLKSLKIEFSSNGKSSSSTGDNYEWLDRLADACLDQDLPDLKEIELIEGSDVSSDFVDSEMPDFALRPDIQEKFDRARVDVRIQVKNHKRSMPYM